MSKPHTSVLSFAALLVLSSTTGCDKLKSLAGGGDGGESSGGGILASMFGSDFEGEITMQATSRANAAQGPTTLVFGVKRPKYRVDATGGFAAKDPMMSGASLILDAPAKKGYALVPAKKQAIVLDFDKMKALGQHLPGRPGAGQPGMPTTPKVPPTIEKTGKKDSVAGYTCEIWKITNEGKKAEICAAEGITWIDLGDLGWSSPELTLAAVTSEANRFPLRVVSFDATGVEEMRLEAKKIDKKKLDDARFVVPPDYAVLDMAAMLGGMGIPGMQPGGPGTPGAAPTFQLPKGIPTAPRR